MLKEFVETLSRQAVLASRAAVIETPEPDGTYTLALPDGTVKNVEAQRPNYDHRPADLQAVVDVFIEWDETKPELAQLWYSRAMVITFCGRDRARLDLKPSPQMSMLMKWETQPCPLQQRQMLFALRQTFNGCVSQDILDVLKRVKFENGSVVDSEISNSKTSLGKQLRSEATGCGAIPEWLIFTVPIFESGFKTLGTITCALDVDASQGTFKLVPIAGQVEAVFAAAEAQMGESLKTLLIESSGGTDHSESLFYGQP